MIVIGLTGTTGAGKGEVGRVFASLGACVCDTDRIYHTLLAECDALKRELCNTFGAITDELGNIDRKKLAPIVFSDKAKLSTLNHITHRYVLAETDRILADAAAQGVTVGVIDAPMLYESGADKKCSAVVGVIAPAETRLARIMARDGLTEAAARSRIANQKSDAWFEETCDYTISNDSDIDTLRTKAKEVLEKITAQTPSFLGKGDRGAQSRGG